MKILGDLIKQGVKLTPMMKQYYEIKTNYLDCILLFRMGDFYEVFFDDAKKASDVLQIALTHRGKIQDTPIPMAGIPHHAANNYIDKLTSFGLKVAICEQVEDPKLAKGIVKRAVTQVVSPGIPYDFEKATAIEGHFIVSAKTIDDKVYASAIDFTTGEFFGSIYLSENDFFESIISLGVKELLTYPGQFSEKNPFIQHLKNQKTLITFLAKDYFSQKNNKSYISRLIPNFQRDKILEKNKSLIDTVSPIGFYISSTGEFDKFYHISPYKFIERSELLNVTLSTLQGLEILPSPGKNYKDSLLGYIDLTNTSMGSRKLKSLFLSPIQSKEVLNDRLDTIENFIKKPELIQTCQEKLKSIKDIERILAKITTGKANSTDLINLKYSSTHYFEMFNENLKSFSYKKMFHRLTKKDQENLGHLSEVIDLFINEEIGANSSKGNLIKPGADKKRDRLAKLCFEANTSLSELEEKYRQKTKISKLKVKYNNIAGYFIEVSKLHSDKLPKSFERKQTLVNSERFVTKELREFENEVLAAREKLEILETELFNNVISLVKENNKAIQKLGQSIANLDVFIGLSLVAIKDEFSKPELQSKKILKIEKAFHPLLKSTMEDEFIHHDIILDENNFFGLITGPNMAGKTTVMREVSIIQFLAQIGSYVPAKSAQLGICDYIFSRLGANDDILKGQSTFMVEMGQTAEILRHATENSLIILDEVGRGTSTYDGMSIAWSLIEYFVTKTKALTLFSTHYHELIELVESLTGAKNFTVKTIKSGNDVKFLYTLIEGATNQSFGIHVAKLAGLPKEILNRSSEMLKTLEKEKTDHLKNNIDGLIQLDLFSEEECLNTQEKESVVEAALKELNINNLTPLNAINELNKLQQLIQ